MRSLIEANELEKCFQRTWNPKALIQSPVTAKLRSLESTCLPIYWRTCFTDLCLIEREISFHFMSDTAVFASGNRLGMVCKTLAICQMPNSSFMLYLSSAHRGSGPRSRCANRIPFRNRSFVQKPTEPPHFFPRSLSLPRKKICSGQRAQLKIKDSCLDNDTCGFHDRAKPKIMGTSVFESYDFAGNRVINLIFSTKNPSINIALPTHQAGETRICLQDLGI